MSLELPLPSASKVTFIFDGLFFFAFRDGVLSNPISNWREGQVGILPGIPNHPLKIVIESNRSDKPLLEFTDPGHRLSRLLDRIVIKKDEFEERRVTRDDHPIDRYIPNVNARSFNWVIDFEGLDMHYNNPLIKNPNVLRPRLIFQGGDFYTALVNHCPQYLIRKYQHEEISTDFGHVARFMGVDINLGSSGSLLVEIGGVPFTLAENMGDPEIHYTITISNNEPEDQPHADDESDIHFFYDHFLTDPTGLSFDFVPKDKDCTESGEPAVPPYVCYGTTGSKTNQIP
ncbi:MAG: hypothetical protein WBV94_10490 [Blastocatellia bacterium]